MSENNESIYPWAVMLDVSGIQDYIYTSSKLKINQGASYIIEYLVFGDWVNELLPEESRCYLGGGHALLFFENKNEAEEFVREWSRKILIGAPGLRPVVAIGKFSLDSNNYPDNFSEDFSKIGKLLMRNKRCYPFMTEIPYQGITQRCDWSGGNCSTILDFPEQRNVSFSVAARLQESGKAKKKFEENFLGSQSLCLPDGFDCLGQKKGEDNRIAVIYIDGNKMGSMFSECKNLHEWAKLSKMVDKIFKDAFSYMVGKLVDSIPAISSDPDFELETNVIPFIPIVQAGDDVCFVTDGRLALWLARTFFSGLSNEYGITATAGVAIVPTKYPFFKAYRCAKSLASGAKRRAHKNVGEKNWIDFHILEDAISGHHELQRTTEQKQGKSLYERPYTIEDFDSLIHKSEQLKKWPKSVIHKLRDAVYIGVSEVEKILEQQAKRERGLEDFSNAPILEYIEINEYYRGF